MPKSKYRKSDRSKRKQPKRMNSPVDAGQSARVYNHMSNGEPAETKHGEDFHKKNSVVDPNNP